jgi:DNA-binding response OmpR family regulator
MKILIAEDDFTSRAVLAGVLKKYGHEVQETTNGSEAWLALQQPDAPRLVILDWMMPELDGPEVLRRVRALPTDRPPYIIMLTAKSEKPNVIAGLDAGANDYLAKPFDPGELIARVEVGERMVEMQLRRHEQRANAQRLRVEASQRMLEMQDTLAAKANELLRCKTELQTVRDEERAQLARELHDSLGPHLHSLQTDLLWVDGQLQEINIPDLALLSDTISAMVSLVKRLTVQTQILCASRGAIPEDAP